RARVQNPRPLHGRLRPRPVQLPQSPFHSRRAGPERMSERSDYSRRTVSFRRCSLRGRARAGAGQAARRASESCQRGVCGRDRPRQPGARGPDPVQFRQVKISPQGSHGGSGRATDRELQGEVTALRHGRSCDPERAGRGLHGPLGRGNTAEEQKSWGAEELGGAEARSGFPSAPLLLSPSAVISRWTTLNDPANRFATQVKSTLQFKKLLQEQFGMAEFRPGQEAVLDALSTRKAALAVFPTGGGKSLCYQLPALAFEGVTLVVSPLIALMKDQIDFLTGRGINAARLDSSLPAEESRAVGGQLRAGTLKLLYVAPERFNNERFLESLKRVKVALFAIDEAHCISEWGHNFRPDYLKLAETAKALRVERVLALTATATPAVVEDICSGFGIPRECAFVTGFYRSNLNLFVSPVRAEERDALLLERLRTRAPGPAIVYVTLQKTAERVAADLEQAGFSARPYHAGLEAGVRTHVQERWMASDRNIVVATIAFGMGIDKANVRYVYHYNLPKSLESYSQE